MTSVVALEVYVSFLANSKGVSASYQVNEGVARRLLGLSVGSVQDLTSRAEIPCVYQLVLLIHNILA